MKDLIRSLFRSFGFEIRKSVAKPNGELYPYVEEFKLDEINFKYWVTDEVYKSWYNPEGHANWHETQEYFKLIKKDEKVLEVGCNNGFTMSLLKGITGKDTLFVGMDIVSFNCQIACSQIGLNGFTNCHILNIGGSDTSEQVEIAITHNGRVVNSNIGYDTTKVDTMKCDDLIPQFDYFDVLKIDVEGFEAKVLKGCKELLSKQPKLIIEIHGMDLQKFDTNYEEIFDLIQIDKYRGTMCLRGSSEAKEIDVDFLRKEAPHATLFLEPLK
ncbi:FkbM family methyltransferase [Flexithrix dorotheae]|uniref:FkbM family methyltransferase n=1 Tax=Flexithrix dorotheae TaxID=70993 RepID=UPI0003A7A300|nr:FkbM family methyltransferase [Flexithrix dorotheae]